MLQSKKDGNQDDEVILMRKINRRLCLNSLLLKMIFR